MSFEKTIELADSAVKRFPPEKLVWTWGEALFTYSLSLLDDYLKEPRYFDYYKRYIDAHIEKGYRVDQSDTAAPGLTAYALYLKTGDQKYRQVVDKVVSYMKTTDRILEHMPNHLGHSPESWVYPKSVWVDSIMMYGVFTSWYGKSSNDEEIYDFARCQPELFSKYLQDRDDKLFYHSYWVKAKHTWPRNKIYWARGNGWVIAAIPRIVNYFPDPSVEREEALRIYLETSKALLPYQRPDGFFETVLNKPGKTYCESSATALIAGGWLQGINQGILDESYREPAMRAMDAVTGILDYKDGMLSMPWISGPTIPVHIAPYWGYKLTPRGRDWKFGLATYIFAGTNYQKLLDSEKANSES